MKRFIDDYLIEWKDSGIRKPLLIRGARQVGKTYAVRNLGKSFNSFVEINFELEPRLISLFEKDLQPERIIRELSIVLKKPIVPGKTLLFFDEIQAAPQAIMALRYFYELMPLLHVIAAGSLLDFATELIGLPVGRVMSFYMYPMSFIEFLYTRNELLAQKILEPVESEVLSEIIHDDLLSYIGEYIGIGGMPEIVRYWNKTQDALGCFELQQILLDTYRQDFNKYAKRLQVKYLELLFNHIPLSLGRKFKYSSIGDYQKRELAPCLELLKTAGVINTVVRSDGQGIPLGAQVHPQDFKIIFLDIALSQAVLGMNTGEWLIDPLGQIVNKGEVVEAFVGQEILAYSNPLIKPSLYYWQREARGSEAEVDYLIQNGELVIPVEVKGGKGSTLKSMHMFLESHAKSPYGIRFSMQNYSVFEKIYSYPLYAIIQGIKHGLK